MVRTFETPMCFKNKCTFKNTIKCITQFINKEVTRENRNNKKDKQYYNIYKKETKVNNYCTICKRTS